MLPLKGKQLIVGGESREADALIEVKAIGSGIDAKIYGPCLISCLDNKEQKKNAKDEKKNHVKVCQRERRERLH